MICGRATDIPIRFGALQAQPFGRGEPRRLIDSEARCSCCCFLHVTEAHQSASRFIPQRQPWRAQPSQQTEWLDGT
jgi:hypothetical protein